MLHFQQVGGTGLPDGNASGEDEAVAGAHKPFLKEQLLGLGDHLIGAGIFIHMEGGNAPAELELPAGGHER